MSEETLFHEALSKPSSERAAFLEQACAGQPELRAAVEALLAAHDASGSLLDRPPQGLGQTVDPDAGPADAGLTGAHTPHPEEAPAVCQRAPTGAGTVIAGR